MKKLLGTLLVAASLCLSGCGNETNISKQLKIKEICMGYYPQNNTYYDYSYCAGREHYNSAAGLNGNGINPSRIKHIDTISAAYAGSSSPSHTHIIVYYYE